MIITKTPFRMSFFGGGTDMPEFFREYGGSVLSTTFDKYCYVTVRHLPGFFEYSTELSYSKIERVKDSSELEHPAVRHAMEMLNMKNLRITYEADLPARSGLGTSSTFAVGMLNAFHALSGEYADKRCLAEEAIYLERTLCNEAGGWQDQIAASFGGMNRINFKGDSFEVLPVIISPGQKERLNQNLLLYFTGFTRFSSDIQRENHITSRDKAKELQHMLSLVDDAEEILRGEKGNLDDFGYLLHETWMLKRQTGSKVSNPRIDEIYEDARRQGALGGKLLGAGGGGFFLFYVPTEKLDSFKAGMKYLMEVPFSFEEDGTRILYYTPEATGRNKIAIQRAAS